MKFPINRYPYTDYNKINLDWIMKKLQHLVNEAIPDIIPIRKGGTGATTAAAARTNLGLGAVATENTIPISKGGTGATTAEEARNNLGLGSLPAVIPISQGGTGATTAEDARTNLGLGAAALENVVPISKGGTGATTAEEARTNLGLGATTVIEWPPVQTVSCPNNTSVEAMSYTITEAGTYLLILRADYASNNSGLRSVSRSPGISYARTSGVIQMAVTGAETYMQYIHIGRYAAGETITLYLYQTSGTTLNCYPSAALCKLS